MKYVWINPVVEKMYEEAKLNLQEELYAKGFTQIRGNPKVVGEVRKEFVEAAKKEHRVVLDTRCPLAIDTIEQLHTLETFYKPKTFPILISMALDLYESNIKNKNKVELHIICPCKELSTLGKKVAKEKELANIYFYSFHTFRELYDLSKVKATSETPIPLGFFEGQGIRVKSLTGERAILKEVIKTTKQEVDFIEMLYCQGGCQSGNGVC